MLQAQILPLYVAAALTSPAAAADLPLQAGQQGEAVRMLEEVAEKSMLGVVVFMQVLSAVIR